MVYYWGTAEFQKGIFGGGKGDAGMVLNKSGRVGESAQKLDILGRYDR